MVTPSWVDTVPSRFGHASAGSVKAAQWKILFSIYIPVAALSLWCPRVPGSEADADEHQKLLDCIMHLTCICVLVGKQDMTRRDAQTYLASLKSHVDLLRELFPGWILPSHHLAFHIYDGLLEFGSARNWWTFPYERLIGQLQKLMHNHKHGESILEITSSSDSHPA